MNREVVEIVFKGDASSTVAAAATARAAIASLNEENDAVDVSMRRVSRSTDGANRSLRDFNQAIAATRNLIGLLKLPALAAGAGVAASSITALSSGVIGLTGALGPLSGALVAIPSGLGAIAQAAGAGVLALGGVGDALGLMKQQAEGAGAAAADTASAVEGAADQIAAAERAIQEAQRASKEANDELIEAREQARRQMIDMRLAAEGAALGQRQATLALQEARRAERETLADPMSGQFDRRAASMAVEEAELALRTARVENRRSQEDLTESEREGVRGSEEVRAAREAIRDAARAESDAIDQLADAHEAVAEAQKSSSTAASNLQTQMTDMPQSAREFARFLYDLKPALDELKQTSADAFLPGLQRGIQLGMRNFDSFQEVIEDTGSVMGDLSRDAGRMFGSAGFGRDMEIIGHRNAEVMRDMGGAGLELTSALRHVMVAADPLLRWMSDSVLGWAENVDAMAKAGRESGELGRFFEETREVMEQVGDILGPLAKGLFDVASAAAPLGRDILDSWEEGAKNFERWADSAEGQRDLREYFRDMRPVLFELGRLARDFAAAIIDLGDDEGVAPLIRQFRTELLPTLEDIVRTGTEAFGPHLVDALVEVGRLLESMMGNAGGLTLFLRGTTGVLQTLNDIIDEVPVLGKVLGTALGAASIYKLLGIGSALTGLGRIGDMIRGIGQVGRGGGLVEGLSRNLGMPGATPARPMFVSVVGGGGLPGGAPVPPTGGGPSPLGRLGGFARFAGFAGMAIGTGMLISELHTTRAESLADALGNVRAQLEGMDRPAKIAGDAAAQMTDDFEQVSDSIRESFDQTFSGEITQERGSLAHTQGAEQLNDTLDSLREKYGTLGAAAAAMTGENRDALLEMVEDADTAGMVTAETLREVRDAVDLGGPREEIRTLVEQAKAGGVEITRSQVAAWVRAGEISSREGARMLDVIREVRAEHRQTTENIAQGKGMGIGEAVTEDRKVTERELERIKDEISLLPPKMKREAGVMTVAWAKEQQEQGNISQREYRAIRENVEEEVGQITRAQVRAGVKQVRATAAVYDSMQAVAEAGLTYISSQTAKALKGLGGKDVGWVIDAAKPVGAGLLGGLSSMFMQRGGRIDQGAPVGDSVPALLERDEYVLNRKAVREIGVQNLDALNFGVAPRFQEGGFVGMQMGGDVGGLNPPFRNFMDRLYDRFGGTVTSGREPRSLHATGNVADWAPADWAGASRYLNTIGSKLIEGIYNPGTFGGPPLSWDTGVQVPHSFWEGEWANHLDHIHLGLMDGVQGVAVQAAREIGKMLVKGPPGALRDVAQGAIDLVREAANDRISRENRSAMASVHGGGAVSGRGMSAGGAFDKGELADLWIGARGPASVANTAAAIALAESSGDPNAQGPLTSYGFRAAGLWQIHPPQGNDFDPETNARYAVGKYRGANNSFSPWEVYTSGAYRQYLQLGGLVRKMLEGGVVGRPLPRELQKYNKIYPESYLGRTGAQMPANHVAMLAEFIGDVTGSNMPGGTMEQISRAESVFHHPGAIGDDAAAGYGNTFGLGLYQITTGVGHGALIDRLGGEAQMRNPVSNTIAASKLYDQSGLSPWFGTRFLTDRNKHWRGDFGELVSAARPDERDGQGGGGGEQDAPEGGGGGEQDAPEGSALVTGRGDLDRGEYPLANRVPDDEVAPTIRKVEREIRKLTAKLGRADLSGPEKTAIRQRIDALKVYLTELKARLREVIQKRRKKFRRRVQRKSEMPDWSNRIEGAMGAVEQDQEDRDRLGMGAEYIDDPIGKLTGANLDLLGSEMGLRHMILGGQEAAAERHRKFDRKIREEEAKPRDRRDEWKIRAWKNAQGGLVEWSLGHQESLNSLHGLGSTRDFFSPPYGSDSPPYLTLGGDIGSTQTELKDLAGQASQDDSPTREALEEINRNLRAEARLRAGEFETFSHFLREMRGVPFVGAFEKGTDYVPQTGMALVHQGERIVPAGGGDTQVVLVLKDRAGAMVELVDSRIESKRDSISRGIGHDTRVVTVAPGTG